MLTHNIIPFPSSNDLSSTPYSLCPPLYTPAVRISSAHTHLQSGELSLSLYENQKKKENSLKSVYRGSSFTAWLALRFFGCFLFYNLGLW
jgi:hypothetical protein